MSQNIDFEIIKRLCPDIWHRHKEFLQRKLEEQGSYSSSPRGLAIEDLLGNRTEIFYYLASELMRVNGDDTPEYVAASNYVSGNGESSEILTKTISAYALSRIKESMPVSNL